MIVDSKATSAGAAIDPDAVFAALDKVVAETSLTSVSAPEVVETPLVVTTTKPVEESAPTGIVVTPQPLLKVVVPTEIPGKDFWTLVKPQSPVSIAFPTEEAPPVDVPRRRWEPARAITVALGAVAVVEFLLLAAGYFRQPPAIAPAGVETVTIESLHPGAMIAIDGHDRGTTPSTLALPPGRYVLAITDGAVTRQMLLNVMSRTGKTRIYFETGDTPQASAAQVPVAAALQHQPLQPAAAAATASVPPANAVGGWVSVNAPIDVQLFEGGALIGSNQTDRVMLPVGRHVLTAVNATLGYKETTTVQVVAGSVAKVRLEMPPAAVNINAVPWADVSVDGKHVGATPLGNISLPIGPHEVVFVHPQLGERRQTVTVTLNGTNRVTVNLNQR